MNEPPKIVEKKNLVYYWFYKNEQGNDISLVARYQDPDKPTKKWFRQYSFKNQEWEEGATTPSPLYGINTLSTNHSVTRAYILEGEKCASAAHTLDLVAITSMMGSSNVEKADWSILARYRHIQEFVLVPDNDDPGHRYMSAVFKEIQKACPDSKVVVCKFQNMKKGEDLVDWLKLHLSCPQDWNGFNTIQKPNSTELQKAFLEYSTSNLIEADVFFSNEMEYPIFESDPQPLEEISFQTLPCPLHTLADPIVHWTQGVSMQMQISEDYAITPFLVSVGSLIGRKRGLELRPGSRWIEFANLWGMCVGRPAMMKSPAMNAAFHFLVVLANRAKAHFEQIIKKYQKECEICQIKKKVREDEYKRELKEAIKNHKDQANIHFHEEDPPQEPKRKRYKTQDATIEKLTELLIDNPQGLLLYRDELAGWFHSFEKHGHENDREFYLESWSGKGDYDVDRIGRGSLFVPALCLSIFGSIQPGPLSKYIRDTVRGGSGDNGLIQRFQAIVCPEPNTTWELVEGISISELEEPVQKIFDHLDRLEFDQDKNPVILSFTSEAQAHFDQWQQTFENKIRSGKLPPYLEAHLSKYKKLLPSLCLIIEHLNQALLSLYPQSISIKSLRTALLWLDYFESHACRIYNSSANAVLKAAQDLVRRVRNEEIPNPFTARDVYHGKHWTGLTDPEEVREVIELLIEKDCLRATPIKTGGRSTVKYWLHEKFFDEKEGAKGS
ncbi:DUF3987 domain-containing protein [Parachlamydia acanthamoebae]|uniref:DUF3987 domain-containing protein n=1 Tax=Parachlamydia acanthamoebae TaxID=83552 RepID=UPI000750BD95|nr:YfjI family protein [Parachlamydia acanthamoebae]